MSRNVNEVRSTTASQQNGCPFCHAIELLFTVDASKGEPDSKTYTFEFPDHGNESHIFKRLLSKMEFVTEDYSRHGPFLKFIMQSCLDYQTLEKGRRHISQIYDIHGIHLSRNRNAIPQIQALDYKGRPRFPRELLLKDSLESGNGPHLHETALNTD